MTFVTLKTKQDVNQYAPGAMPGLNFKNLNHMNTKRRQFIEAQITALGQTKENMSTLLDIFKDTFETIKENIQMAEDDEQEYYDNMPEGLQGSEKGQNAEQAASELSDARGNLETLIDTISELDNNVQEIMDGLTTVIENY